LLAAVRQQWYANEDIIWRDERVIDTAVQWRARRRVGAEET